ncbi:MAG: hypothetical protein JNM97_20755 [Rhodoferax sp.]|nr:hypothetical protein [Rhodoferax sp.]
MQRPTPAIVAQAAVRRLPRWAMALFCLAYAVPGFVGRAPWKSADMASFGYMLDMARGRTGWTDPRLVGLPPEADGLLPYWLGAACIRLLDGWLDPAAAARLPFFLLLGLAMVATWYAVYELARQPQAQPVAFAFGGEARPADYARAIADGGVLALIACLGLAQLGHEATPSVAQLAFIATAFFGLAALGYWRISGTLAAVAGLLGLALSGAPSLAVLLGAGSLLVHAVAAPEGLSGASRWRVLGSIALATLAAATLASVLDLWRWRILLPSDAGSRDWRNLGRLLLWFTWPAWPLALWTLWRWRARALARAPSLHIVLPLWFVLVCVGATLTTRPSDRALLLALPALATLAAFALPTLQRSVGALIDWFTLLFFTGCGAIIWVIWIGLQTGFPRQAATNALRQAPEFEATFSLPALLVALLATVLWGWLVRWRVGRHRTALWKSLVLPAGGAALCWLLLMTLWMPLLDYVRSYQSVAQKIVATVGTTGCVQEWGLTREQVAAIQYHAGYRVSASGPAVRCDWLILNPDPRLSLAIRLDDALWDHVATIRRPSEKADDVVLFRRRTGS